MPCVQCDRREVGLAWGDYCAVCQAERQREANHVAQRVAIGGAAVLAAYLIWDSPNELMPRIFAAASVLLAYVILRRVTARVVLELKRVDPGARERTGGQTDGRAGGPADGWTEKES